MTKTWMKVEMMETEMELEIVRMEADARISDEDRNDGYGDRDVGAR